MLKVVEAFSGIGSQAKALKNIKVEYEILATIDWDINAIIAYDIIHNGTPDLTEYTKMSKEHIIKELSKYKLSLDGKKPLDVKSIKRKSKLELEHLLAAINRSNNLVNIQDVQGHSLPDEVDLFTYSFPCQDLSIARAWHGESGGIDRNVKNRSGMLWEVERILFERNEKKLSMPKFLLMENVSNILSNTHKENFKQWIDGLTKLGYYNYIYRLNSKDFGIPQKRERVYMLSVFYNNNIVIKQKLDQYLRNHDLNNLFYVNKLNIKTRSLKDILKLEYNENLIYKIEADRCQPNDTKSRRKIYNDNDLIYDNNRFLFNQVSTITTKQDRNPNSGVIFYDYNDESKSKFRYLTPRECFLLMGFDEEDYDSLVKNDFYVCKGRKFFVDSKLYKMAGNSIVVKVLEEIFKQIDFIDKNLLN